MPHILLSNKIGLSLWCRRIKQHQLYCLNQKTFRTTKNLTSPSSVCFYDNDVVDITKNVQPSEQNELEITSVNKEYLRNGKLSVTTLNQGDAWLDTGTIDSMNEAAGYVRILQKRTGVIISNPEAIAFKEGFISANQLDALATPLTKSGYGEYLLRIKK